MNIFTTSPCPKESAEFLDDRRCIKMCLESTQMLCTALTFHCNHYKIHYATGVKFKEVDGKLITKKGNKRYYWYLSDSDLKIYAPTHPGHPCNVWVRKSRENWCWLWNHAINLCGEYTYRYGKVHASFELLNKLLPYASNLPSDGLTPFVNCAAHSGLGLDYKHVSDVHEAYKQYLAERWKTDKRKPTWYGKSK